ncbi:peptidase inhibitor family I36 protein [Streptomyces sp. CAU 1734]|uniref:peptidase inhibitor family I36 protein n=1 Tax=Streptomyces sp. CAU 1734 TaxID=3140360 RepID=UPI003260AEB3
MPSLGVHGRKLALFGGAALLALGSGLGGGVAQAGPLPTGTCPAGKVCFFPQANYQGTPHIIDFTAVPGCQNAFQARSVINNQIHPVTLYVDAECTQYLDQVDPGQTRSSLIAGVVTAE